MPKYSSENIIKVYDDDTGESIYIGPDGDGLDLAEIRALDKDGTIYSKGNARITMHPEQAVLVAEAILKLYKK